MTASAAGGVLLRAVRLADRVGPCDVLVLDGRVARIGERLRADVDNVVDAAGGALLPGLHDHHIHLLATAAAAASVPCGPPAVRDRDQLRAALAAAVPADGWVRGVGYDDSVAGDLDARALDTLRPDVAVRVQHRSGALWVLNTRGLRQLALEHGDGGDGIERDVHGTPTGRLWRADRLLRRGPHALPDLGELSLRLARLGITGVTDATPDLDADAADHLTRSMRQRVLLLGTGGAGPRKLVVRDDELPTFDALASAIGAARPRAVAVHCVTRVALVLTIAVLREVGTVAGDRIEHAAVVPPEVTAELAALRVRVVTQPSLVARRGDDYLDRVEPDDRDCLWPFASLLAAGVRVAASSDAPYGDPDPWAALRAAVERAAPSGRRVAPHEAVTAAQALHGYLTDPLDPGGVARPVHVGAPADLVLLDRPLPQLLRAPTADAVALTLIGGVRAG